MIVKYAHGENFRITNGQHEDLPLYVRSSGLVFWKDVTRLYRRFDNVKVPKKHRKKLLEIRRGRYRHGGISKGIDQLANLPYSLFTYQIVGANYLVKAKTAILADDVGLGKTFQFCAAAIWAILNDNIDQVLILTRTSVKYQIRDEIYRFFVPRSLPDMEVEVIEGTPEQRKKQWLDGKAIQIASYEQLRNDHDFLKKMQKEEEWNPGVWILDEASKIKNHTTKVSRKVKSLSKQSKYRWAITATPIENGLEDLYSISEFVQPGLFINMKHFRKTYIREVLIRDENGFVRFKKFEGYKNLNKARKRLRGYYLRRTVKDIGIVLPPLIATLVSLPPNKLQKTLYKQIKKKYNVLAAVTKARLLCGSPYLLSKKFPKESPKIKEILELLNGELKNKQVVIATQYKSFLKLISENIKEPHGIISGDIKAKNREILRRQFQAGDIRIMLMTDAGEYGLNLQAGSVLINADCPWNPAKLKQRIGRIYRIDTKNDNIQVINLVIKDTIEERVVRRLKEKEQVFQEIFESDGIEKLGDPIKRLGTKGLEELL